MRLLALSLLVLAAPACAGYGPTDPSSRPAPVRTPASVEVAAPLTDDGQPAAAPSTAALLETRVLAIPVAGVAPQRLQDSFTAGRDGGRRHNAIDIMAGHGTPVVAADSGRILRLSRSNLGGITIYATDPAGALVYYYAHLSAYRDGLAEGTLMVTGSVRPEAPKVVEVDADGLQRHRVALADGGHAARLVGSGRDAPDPRETTPASAARVVPG